MKSQFFSNAKGLLIDLDGVVYVGDGAIDGAVETINWLKEKSLACRFLTNTTTRSLASLHSKLTGLGLPIDKQEILSATYAGVLYLRQQGRPSCHLLLTDDPKDDFAEFPQNDINPNYVVVGDLAKSWSYDVMNRAFNMILGGAKLLALHKGRYWQTEEGLRMDIGAFVAGLEYVTGQEAVVIGKPSPQFFRMALGDMGLTADEVVMIGDDIHNDIGGAQKAGHKAVLVRTGKYRSDLVEQSGIEPDLVIDSIAQLPDYL